MTNCTKAKYRLRGEIKKITCHNDICTLAIAAPSICRAAAAGQFVMVKAAAEKSCDPLLRRPFSIHQITGDLLTLVFKVVGRGTGNLAKMRTGEWLDVVGPLGKGFHITKGPRHYLVGGGMGIAPMHFLAESIRQQDPDGEIIALLGARTARELDAFAHINALQFLQVKISTDDGTAGHRGLVLDLLTQSLAGKGPGAVYCCGPWPMMQAVGMYCNNKKLACQVSLETIMACGIGACLGCAVSGAEVVGGGGYLHACKDGPVFEAGSIWV